MIALEELQRQFQRFVLGGDFAILRSIEEGPRGRPGPRLAIYHDAYRIRLSEALADTFGTLREHLGPAAFDAACVRYVEAEPSTVRSIRWYGAGLAGFLGTTPPYDERPWLAELARFDWALVAAFDAADAPCATVESLVTVPEEDWIRVAFTFHSSVRRLSLRTNAPALRKAGDAGEPLPRPVVLEEPVEWLVWRSAGETRFRSLDGAEAVALDAAVGGAVFARVCELVSTRVPIEEAAVQAASWLRRWVDDGLVARVRTHTDTTGH